MDKLRSSVTVRIHGVPVKVYPRQLAYATVAAMKAAGVLSQFDGATVEAKLQWAHSNIAEVAKYVDMQSWQEEILGDVIAWLRSKKSELAIRRLLKFMKHPSYTEELSK